MRRAGFDSADMPRKPLQRYNILYIGPWLTKLGRKAGEVAKKAGVDEGYMSQLVSGEKKNPAAAQLMAIAEELGISVNALYRRPPEVDITDRVQRLKPDQIEALGAFLEDFKSRKGS